MAAGQTWVVPARATRGERSWIRLAAMAGLVLALLVGAVPAYAAPKKKVKIAVPADSDVAVVKIKTEKKPKTKVSGGPADIIVTQRTVTTKKGALTAIAVINPVRASKDRPGEVRSPAALGTILLNLKVPVKGKPVTVADAFNASAAQVKGIACGGALRTKASKVLSAGGLTQANGQGIADSIGRLLCGQGEAFDVFVATVLGLDGANRPDPNPGGGTPDTTPPPAPVLSGTSPASPADNTGPRVLGSAEPGSTVELFTNGSCSGTRAAQGSAELLGGVGIQVTVPNGVTTTLSARATDGAGNTSACSNAISYVEIAGAGLGNPTGRMVFRVEGDPAGQPPGNPPLADGIYRVAPQANAVPQDLSTAFDVLDTQPPAFDDEFINTSPDGNWLVSQSARFGCDAYPCLNLVAGNVASGQAIAINPAAPAGQPGEDGFVHHTGEGLAAVANSGNRVVFVADGPVHNRDLWVTNRIGATNNWTIPQLLTAASPRNNNIYPAISTDGSQVLFDCGSSTDPQSGIEAICRVNTDGTGFVEMIDGDDGQLPHEGGTPGLHHPDFLAGGAGIVFESTWQGQQSIWTLATGSNSPARLPSAGTNHVGPCTLPSGHVASLDLSRPGNTMGLHEFHVANLTTPDKLYPLLDVDIFDIGIGCGA